MGRELRPRASDLGPRTDRSDVVCEPSHERRVVVVVAIVGRYREGVSRWHAAEVAAGMKKK